MPEHHNDDNPLWQGPCGDGPLGGITQSMLVRFLSCRDRFRLRYVHGLETPDKWHRTFGYGNMWHVCEEAFAKGESWLYALESHTRDLNKRYPLQQEDIMKWFNVCKVQFPEYVKHWHNHPDVLSRKPLMQEQVFDVPYTLPSGRVVRLRGKWDSVDLINIGKGCSKCFGHGWHYTNAIGNGDKEGDYVGDPEPCPHCSVTGIWLQENKTKGDIDKIQVERQLKFDLQTMLYLAALREVNNKVGLSLDDVAHKPRIPIMGVRYNVVRRPLSGGKGNISPHKAKSTKTKFTPAETSEHFYERLRRDYFETEPDYWFFRVRAEISQQDIEVFRKTCLDPLLETLCVWYECVTGCLRITPLDVMRMMNYRTPFGVWSALEEGGSTEYDNCLATGSEVGLRRVHQLFTELQ